MPTKIQVLNLFFTFIAINLQASLFEKPLLYNQKAIQDSTANIKAAYNFFVTKSAFREQNGLQEGFNLADLDMENFIKKHVIQIYLAHCYSQSDELAGFQILDQLGDMTHHAIKSIHKNLESKVCNILIDVLDSEFKGIENVQAPDKQILDYVSDHKEFGFQVSPVIEKMIQDKNFKPLVAQFIIDNIRITQPVPNINIKYDNGDTPLIESVDRNNTQAVQVLLTAGADVNLQDINGYSALNIARHFVVR